jgi:ribosomal protein L37AE/L43A
MSEPRATTVATAPAGERAVPYHCPFCAEEDLHPDGTAPGAWHCRACLRVFAVKFLGMHPIPAPVVPSTQSGGPS